MKTQIVKSGIFFLVVMLALATSFSGCSKENATTVAPADDALAKEALINYSIAENTGYVSCANTLPVEELSEAEQSALVIMREEEMLAHDVYLAMSQLYTRPVFKNITKSEAVHTEAIRLLLVKYNIADPAANHVTGVFTNPDLQALYNSLVATGSVSVLNGVIVGATIEDLDIYDLHQHLLDIDNKDIIFVFNNLLNGSKNHLRAFYANILALGGTYTPQYISLEEFNAIINQ